MTERGTKTKAPSAVPISDPPAATESSEDTLFVPESDPTGVAKPTLPTLPNAPGSPTYSIRLPLGVAGSVLPKLESEKPALPPSSPVMPRQRGAAAEPQDFSRPVAWRATAEAIRTQSPSPSMQIATIASDFKTTYSTIFREAPAAGWGLASFSLPAGHILVKIPKPNNSDASEDAAAWLIVLLSPIDSSSTEIRVKIQSRRASVYAPAVANFIKQCQIKATGNELL